MTPDELKRLTDLENLFYNHEHKTHDKSKSLAPDETVLLLPQLGSGGTVSYRGNMPNIEVADGVGSAVIFCQEFPKNLQISAIQLIWSTPATLGDMYGLLYITSAGDGEVANTRVTGGTNIAVTCNGVANALNFTPITAAWGVDFNSLVLNKDMLLGFNFTRFGANSSDTLSNVVDVYGLLITKKQLTVG